MGMMMNKFIPMQVLLLLTFVLAAGSVAKAHSGYAIYFEPMKSPEQTMACVANPMLTTDFGYDVDSSALSVAFWTKLGGQQEHGLNINTMFTMSSYRNDVNLQMTMKPQNAIRMTQSDGGYIDKFTNTDLMDWFHFVYTCDDTGFIEMYVNGESIGNLTASMPPFKMSDGAPDSYCFMCLGTYSQDPQTFNKANSVASAMDDFYLLSRAMTAGEVASMYADSRNWNLGDPDVRLYYDFNTNEHGNMTVSTMPNLGNTGSRYDLVGGIHTGSGLTVIEDVTSKTFYNLQYPRLVPSQTVVVNDMGVEATFLSLNEASYVTSMPNGRHPVTDFVIREGEFTACSDPNSAYEADIYVFDSITSDYTAASVGAYSLTVTQSMYIDVDWSLVVATSGPKKLHWTIEDLSGNQYLIEILDASPKPMANFSPPSIVEDAKRGVAITYSTSMAQPYTVTVETISAGSRAFMTNVEFGGTGDELFEGDVIGMNATYTVTSMIIQAPPNFQSLLIDAFCFSATDIFGTTSDTTCMDVTALGFNDLPILTPESIDVVNTQNYTIDLGALVVDDDGDLTSIVVTKLPTKGKLYRMDGQEITAPFTPSGMRPYYYQPVQDVLNVSTFYSFGDGIDLVTGEYNFPRWHAYGIVGDRDEFTYGDTPLGWCPWTKTGGGEASDRGLNSTIAYGKGYYWGPWHASAIYDDYGFTEYIEVVYEKAVYPVEIEIGMARGMGAVKSVYAEHPNGLSRPTGDSGPDRKWIKVLELNPDPKIQTDAQLFGQYHITSEQVCKLATKVNTVRLELDTRTIEDWNEVDYMYLIGSDELPMGVLPASDQQVLYVPFANTWGDDDLEFNAYDCGYLKYSKAVLDETVSIEVTPQFATITPPLILTNVISQTRFASTGHNITVALPHVDQDMGLVASVSTVGLSGIMDVHYNGVLITGQSGVVLSALTDTLTVKPYTCNNPVPPTITVTITDGSGAYTASADFQTSVTCLTDLATPCTDLHWGYSLGECSSDNTRQGTYHFIGAAPGARSTGAGLCCNSENEDAYVCPTGLSLPGSFEVDCDYIVEDSDLAIAMLVLLGIGIVTMAGLFFFILFNKTKDQIKSSQPPFLLGSCAGSMICLIAICIYPGEWTDGRCQAFLALLSIGFTMMYANQIFNNQTLKGVSVTAFGMHLRVCALIFVDIVLLLAFFYAEEFGAGNITKTVDGRDIVYKECVSDGVICGILIMVFKVVQMVYGCFTSYKVRKAPGDFQEAKWITLGLYNSFFCIIVVLPLYLLMEIDNTIRFIVLAIGALVTFTVPPCLVIMPKMMAVIRGEKADLMASIRSVHSYKGVNSVGTAQTRNSLQTGDIKTVTTSQST